MITGSGSCYSNVPQGYSPTDTSLTEHIVSSSSCHETYPNSFLYNLSLLKDKVHQVQTLANIILVSSNDHGQNQPNHSKAMAMPTMATLIQEIIVTSSSLMFTCQQMNPSAASSTQLNRNLPAIADGRPTHLLNSVNTSQQGFYSNESLEDWYDNNNYNNSTNNEEQGTIFPAREEEQEQEEANNGMEVSQVQQLSPRRNKYDKVFELDAEVLLAKYTHYCHVCGKGFKRDANLRMHMRAHGDEYKSNAALTNPMKNNNNNIINGDSTAQKLYSCPQEGCRWNKKHAKFQPLKSMICVKNHYKRSHCPKMYVCKRCNKKQFALLSDLRTHEKHCGDEVKWQCSCGTTFSRKDKLMGHVSLFVGHTPVFTTMRYHLAGQMQLDGI